MRPRAAGHSGAGIGMNELRGEGDTRVGDDITEAGPCDPGAINGAKRPGAAAI